VSLLPACSQELIPSHITSRLPAGDAFDQIMALKGDVYRDMPGRLTIRVVLGGESYFIKQHFGVGWREIFKNLITLRLPILSALTEWRAIARLDEIGIPTTPAVAYGCRGNSPASLRSFIVTKDLGDIVSLETLCADWKHNPPDARFKRRLILEVARIARLLHGSGLNHRDFYICHFCLDNKRLANDEIHLYLIDLHRVGIRPVIATSARMKDIAALYFSALDIGLTPRDCLRFLRAYQGDLHQVKREPLFWKQVDKRARKLFLKFHGYWPITPFDKV
jgi:heptose I phosphotransferase